MMSGSLVRLASELAARARLQHEAPARARGVMRELTSLNEAAAV